MSKYGVFSGPYFTMFGLNAGKYGPEKTPYLDTFHTVILFNNSSKILKPFREFRTNQQTCNTAQKIKFSIKDFFRKCDQVY